MRSVVAAALTALLTAAGPAKAETVTSSLLDAGPLKDLHEPTKLRYRYEMKGQSITIAAVIAAGAAMFVTYLSNFDSLRRTRAIYYETARFADVFAATGPLIVSALQTGLPIRAPNAPRSVPGLRLARTLSLHRNLGAGSATSFLRMFRVAADRGIIGHDLFPKRK